MPSLLMFFITIVCLEAARRNGLNRAGGALVTLFIIAAFLVGYNTAKGAL